MLHILSGSPRLKSIQYSVRNRQSYFSVVRDIIGTCLSFLVHLGWSPCNIQLLSASGYGTKSSKLSYSVVRDIIGTCYISFLVHPGWSPCDTVAECFGICNTIVIVIFPSCSFNREFPKSLRISYKELDYELMISIARRNRECNILRGFCLCLKSSDKEALTVVFSFMGVHAVHLL